MPRLVIAATAIFLADQIAKFVVVVLLDLRNAGEIVVWPPFLQFRMAWNQGVNFGLFANDVEILRWLLIVIALGISGWLARWALKTRRAGIQILAGIVIGGALGNALDRVIHGAVADFLNMSCCGLNNPYAFNIADIAIFFGALGLVLISNRLENGGGRT